MNNKRVSDILSWVKQNKIFVIICCVIVTLGTTATVLFFINIDDITRWANDEPIVVKPLTGITEVSATSLDEKTMEQLTPIIQNGKDTIIQCEDKVYAVVTSGSESSYDISYDIINRIDGTSIIAYKYDILTNSSAVRYKIFELSSTAYVRMVNTDIEKIEADISDGLINVIVSKGSCVYKNTILHIDGLEKIEKSGIYSVLIEDSQVVHYTEVVAITVTATVLEQTNSLQMRNFATLSTNTNTLDVYLIKTTTEVGQTYDFTLTLTDDILYAEANRSKGGVK